MQEETFSQIELEALYQEAVEELVVEENQKKAVGIETYDQSDFGVTGFETDDAFKVIQDISGIVEDAQIERDMRSDGLMKVEKGVRKFATIPITHMVEYQNKFGVDIMDGEISRDPWEMSKFRMWIQKEHPYLMAREQGTRFNKTV